MAPVYNKLQQAFCLNLIANSASSKLGSAQKLQRIASREIEAVLSNQRIRELIGSWDVIWGPVVWQHKGGDVADNTMYVARNADTTDGNNEVVVAIAGTNPISWFGWLVEDFKVYKTAPWPFNNHTGDLEPRISEGTATGLDVLFHKMSFNDQTLTEFLTTLSGTPLDITVTGHSLGGALSASTALALADLQGRENEWDPDRNAVVSAVPSAGPTPGTADFAQYYTQRIGTRTNRIWNVLDVVPHAWQINQLVQAPHLYYPYLPPNPLIELAVGAAIVDSKVGGTYIQINEQTPGLPGQVYLDKVYGPESPLTEIEHSLFKVAVNKLIAALGKKEGWPTWKVVLLQRVADWLLKRFQSGKGWLHSIVLPDLEKAVRLGDLGIPEDAKPELVDLVIELNGLLLFLIQAAAQHVVAYPGLMGVNEYKQLADKIQS